MDAGQQDDLRCVPQSPGRVIFGLYNPQISVALGQIRNDTARLVLFYCSDSQPSLMDDIPQSAAMNADRLRQLELLPQESLEQLPVSTFEFLQTCDIELEEFQGETRCLLWPFGRVVNCEGRVVGREGSDEPQLVALLTSRMGRDFDAKDAWFQRLRLACAAARQESSIIVTAQNAAGFQFISRSAELFDIPTVQIVVNERIKTSRWLSWVVEECSKRDWQEKCWPVFVSPKLVIEPQCSKDVYRESPNEELPVDPVAPIQDRVVSFLANQLWVLSLRKNGHWHQLIEVRLADRSRPAGNVRLIDGDSSLNEPFANQLHDAGAVRWCLADVHASDAEIENESFDARPVGGNRPTKQSVDASEMRPTSTAEFLQRIGKGERFLTHWTRRSTGPWPGESDTDFVDSYILSESPDRSALGTLTQIVKNGVLKASAQGIRCGLPVISFTAVPLTELIERRHFQTHRNRWDFEHYGLCISRETLTKRYQAQPVIYGDDQTWSELSLADQMLFQQATSKTRTSVIDWTEEEEWRQPCDLRLDDLSTSDCFLFAATIQEAQQLATIQRFPVVSIEELRHHQNEQKPKADEGVQ